MKRIALIYAAILVALLVAGLLFIRLSQTTGTSGALRKLGGGEQEYQFARKKLLFSLGDPSPALLAFLARRDTGRRAKLQALRIIQELAFHQRMIGGGAWIEPLLDDTSMVMRTEALKAIGAVQGLAGTAKVAAMFRDTADTVMFMQSYEALVSALRPVVQTIDSFLVNADTALVDSVARSLSEYPAGKGALYAKLARYYATRGAMEQSAAWYRRLGIVSTWWVVGEFHWKGDQDRFGPELQPFNPRDLFDIAEDSTVTGWFALKRPNDWGLIDFRRLFARQNNTIVYLNTYVHVPTERRALLFFHGDDFVQIRLNDSLVATNDYSFHGEVPRTIRLRAGVNRLFAKVGQGGWGWDLFCRVTDNNGEAMTDISFSLTPDPPDAAYERLIAQTAATGKVATSLLDSVDIESPRFCAGLTDIILDKAATETRRVAAAQVLRARNRIARANWGERDLIQFAEAITARADASNPLLVEICEALADMQTSRAVDIGLKLRRSADEGLRRCGNRLVNGYCRSRVLSSGDPLAADPRGALARVYDELVSIRPADPWVLQQIARRLHATRDSARAELFAAAIRIPARWVARQATVSAWEQGPRWSSLAFPADTIFARETDSASIRAPWWRFAASCVPSNGYRPFVLFDRADIRRSGNELFALATVIRVDSACSALVHVSIPAPYRVWVDGTLSGENIVPDLQRCYLGAEFPSQRINFDVDTWGVRLRAGENRIVIVMRNAWVTDPEYRFMRCSFSRPAGTPMPCEGNRLIQTDW